MLFAELIFVVALGQRWRSRDPERLLAQRSPALAVSLVALFREPENNKKATTTVFATFDPSRYPRPFIQTDFRCLAKSQILSFRRGPSGVAQGKVHLQNFK